MWQKVLIIGFLLVIVFSLGQGLYYMMSDKGKSDRVVKALTWRVGLSVGLFVLLLIGMATGIIEPHGTEPVQYEPPKSSDP